MPDSILELNQIHFQKLVTAKATEKTRVALA